MYELLVFESNSLYHSKTSESEDNALSMFVAICREFVSPEYVAENGTSFDSSSLHMSYADCSGGDKPMLVLLIGTITDEMRSKAQESLKKMYIRICEDCNAAEIPLNRSVCAECAGYM
jgi:hypothetical protein